MLVIIEFPKYNKNMNSTTNPTPSGDDLAGFSWFNGLTDGERAFWLGQAGSAVPAAAWNAFKRVRAGLPPADPAERAGRPVGRPPKRVEDRLIGVSIRMTEAQREKLRRAGGSDAVRNWLDSLPD
jgi:hypothetical protein